MFSQMKNFKKIDDCFCKSIKEISLKAAKQKKLSATEIKWNNIFFRQKHSATMRLYLYIPRQSHFFNFKHATCKISLRINKTILKKGVSLEDSQEMGNT